VSPWLCESVFCSLADGDRARRYKGTKRWDEAGGFGPAGRQGRASRPWHPLKEVERPARCKLAQARTGKIGVGKDGQDGADEDPGRAKPGSIVGAFSVAGLALGQEMGQLDRGQVAARVFGDVVDCRVKSVLCPVREAVAQGHRRDHGSVDRLDHFEQRNVFGRAIESVSAVDPSR